MKISPAIAFLSSHAWALEPGFFTRLVDVVAAHADGVRADADTIAALTAEQRTNVKEPGITWSGRTAIIPVRGVIARYADSVNGACQPAGRSADAIQADLLMAAKSAQTIVLRIDSPGGEVSGTAETAQLIRSISASGIPVVAFADGLMASAAMWMGSQADEIVASAPTAQVGSIGVSTTITESMPNQSRKVHVITSAPAKASPIINEAHIANARALVQDLAAVFADAVAAGRGLDDAAKAMVATGEVWTARQAIAIGLVDRIESFDDMLARLNGPNPFPSVATAAVVTEQPPMASTSAEMEPVMGITMQALAKISAEHPNHLALIVAEAAKDNANEQSIIAAITAANVHAQTAELEAMKAKLEASEKALAEANVKLAAQADQAAKIVAHIPQTADPGALAGPPKLRRSAMNRDEKADYQIKNGVAAYQQLPE